MVHHLMTARVLSTSLVILALSATSSLVAQEAAEQPYDEPREREIERDVQSEDDREFERELRTQVEREVRERLQGLRNRWNRDWRPTPDRFREGPRPRPRQRDSNARPGQPIGPQDMGIARTDDARILHLRTAIQHLQALGWHDEAERLTQRWNEIEQAGAAPPVGPQGPVPGGWGNVAQDQMENMHRMLGQLRQAIENLERRTGDSEQIARSADEAQRRVEEMLSGVEVRAREWERQINQRLREFEQQAARRLNELERYAREFGEGVERNPAPSRDRHEQSDDDRAADESGEIEVTDEFER